MRTVVLLAFSIVAIAATPIHARGEAEGGRPDPQALNAAGCNLLEAGKPREALDLLDAARTALPEGSLSGLRARIGYNRAIALRRLGTLAEADAAFAKAAEASRRAGLQELEARALLGSGLVNLDLGRPSVARARFRSCLERACGETAGPVRLEARQGEILALIRMGALLQAEEACRRSLETPMAGGPEGRIMLHTLLGRALFGLGEYDEARGAFRSALETADAVDDGGARLINMIHLANIDWSLQRFESAREAYGEVVRVARKAEDPLAESDGRLGQGLVAQSTGFWEEAAADYEDALRLSVRGGDLRRRAAALNNLALIRLHREDPVSAGRLFRESAQLYRTAGDARGEALALSNLGEIHRRQGRTEAAGAVLRGALATFDRMGARGGKALSALRLGWVHLDRGDPAGAGSWFRTTEVLAQELGNREMEWRALHGAGTALAREGRTRRALETYLQALQVLEQGYQELGPPNLDLVFRIQAESLYEAVIYLLVSEHEEDEALGWLEKNLWRQRRERLGPAPLEGSPGTRAFVDSLADNRRKLLAYHQALQGKGTIDPGSGSEIRRRLQGCRRERERMLEGLREVDQRAYDEVMGHTPDVGELCRRIPADTVLIEYFSTERELLLFALRREGLRVYRSPVTRQELQADCRRFVDRIVGGDPVDGSIGRIREHGAELYQRLLGPAEEVLAGKPTVGIIPHGDIHRVPFPVLVRRGADGKERYLVEDKNLFCLNVREYMGFLCRKDGTHRRPERLVGFADSRGDLPGSREELREAGALFLQNRLFFGAEARESVAKRLAPSADVLTFSVHGVFNGRGPLGSYLALAADDKDDGRLTAAEACLLRLGGAPLVVLSGCETGLGGPVEGYGRMSLADAFVTAGARCVVNVLWKIDDQATRQFMKAFYERLLNRNAFEVVREVQLAFLSGAVQAETEAANSRGVGKPVYTVRPQRPAPRDLTHPYYWGGFVSVGSDG